MIDPIKQPNIKDAFLLRAIEHWLDSANELGYQPLFCELLINKGFIVKYSIKNTAIEMGKDVVAVDQNGIANAYQLKGRNINTARWRSEVRPEIEAMMDCPIEHPEIDKQKPHISYLVTNGEIEDPVRLEINSLNSKKWKDNPLHVWTRSDLLDGFQQMADGMLPKDAETYKRLIDLIFVNGSGLPDISKIHEFLLDVLNVESADIKKEQRRRDIAAAILYATMIAGPYRAANNYGATIRVLVTLQSLVFYIVEKYELEDRYWKKSQEIIWADIMRMAKILDEELNSLGFDHSLSPYDTDLMPFRRHATMQIVSALKLAEFIDNDPKWMSLLDPKVMDNYQGSLLHWGEASFLPQIFIGYILKNFSDGPETSVSMYEGAISLIIKYNGRNSTDEIGLIPPYYDIDFAVRRAFGLIEEFEGKFLKSSYLLKPLLEMIARLDKKQFIVESWRELSFIHYEVFIPGSSVDYMLWRSKKGENLSIMPKHEKSWKELRAEAHSYDNGTNLPEILKRFPSFIPFYLMTFPHRANSDTLGFLDHISWKKI